MQEIISSRHNPTIVKLCKLSDKKYREADRVFRFDGVKLCAEAIMSGVELEYIFLRRDNSDTVRMRVAELCGKYPEDTGARVILLENSLFDTVSEEKSPEGIISVAKYIDKFHKIVTIDNNCIASLPSGERIMLIEDIRDPGNLGTIMRSAAALGVETLILCGECADIYSSKTLRGSMGALFRLKTVRARNGVDAVKALRDSGRRVFAAALTSEALSLDDAGLEHTDCVVIGNEGHGLSREVIAACDGCVIIPMSAGTESLNAATAAAIFMWEMRKHN